MTDTPLQDLSGPTRMVSALLPRPETPIVPKNSISGRALVAVVAIMTFLVSMTTGAVLLLQSSASDWQSAVASEVSIQVRPVAGTEIESAVSKAAELAKNFPGVVEVRSYSKDESAKLLEPWLGAGLTLDELPVPRMIVVKLASNGADLGKLQSVLRMQVPGASLDDHRGFIARMRAMTFGAVLTGLVILVLMLIATMLSVAFATRGAMAANRPVIEVLHFVGAKNNFIASHFQRHFLMLGLKGGLLGGGCAMLVFALMGFLAGRADPELSLFGNLALGRFGYALLVIQIVLIAMVTAWTSRHTVNRTLETIE